VEGTPFRFVTELILHRKSPDIAGLAGAPSRGCTGAVELDSQMPNLGIMADPGTRIRPTPPRLTRVNLKLSVRNDNRRPRPVTLPRLLTRSPALRADGGSPVSAAPTPPHARHS
jgi:hypothetical protein